MGKPAARVNDPTAHGKPLSPGPGSPDVKIGYMKAWRGIPLAAAGALQAAQKAADTAMKAAETATKAAAGTPAGPAAKLAEETLKASLAVSMGAAMKAAGAMSDIHICPVPVPAPPHGPGVVIDGSPTVLINNMPACRQGDTVLEALGGPDKIVMGCMTVLIGDSGGASVGSGGGFAGGASAMAVAGATASSASPDPYSQKYATAEDAAIAAMQDANPQSKAKNLEMGGWIRKNQDGTFTPQPAVTGSPAGLDNMPSKGSDDVVWWHTHGAYDPAYDNENFSGAKGDKGYSKANNATGYVATPSGTIKRYDPATDTVTTLPDTTE